MDIYDVFENGLKKETYTKEEVQELCNNYNYQIGVIFTELCDMKTELKKIIKEN